MDELEHHADLYALFRSLKEKGLLDRTLWRRFHCTCCREIWTHLDAEMRSAVDLAERYAGQRASAVELRVAYEKAAAIEEGAWRVVESLREHQIPSEWIWPISEAVDEAWVRYCSAGAAKTCALDAPDGEMFSTIPELAACVPAWFKARQEVLQENRSCQGAELYDLVVQRWERIKAAEERKQAAILLSLVGE
jgi:hypothetical protein